jgi:hypothetical protein
MATGKTKDNRAINRALRLPGGGGSGKQYRKGITVTDPDVLEKLAAEKTVNLQELHDTGVISGDWKGVKKAKT